jgi:lipopolysaccharide heptosyltransferase II
MLSLQNARILCVRLDNIGDVIMSTPAFRALKECFNCHLTLLTSSMAAPLAPSIAEIDETIVFNVPWVQNAKPDDSFFNMVQLLAAKKFDAAIIFTVYSQNPLPAAMLVYLAGIPVRLAYCRENPYQLLTHWVPEDEPYKYIRHQVCRDLDLITTVRAHAKTTALSLLVNENAWPGVYDKLLHKGLDADKPWIILHPGVSDAKRRYPQRKWVQFAKCLLKEQDVQLLITGNEQEQEQNKGLQLAIGNKCFNITGECTLEEFIVLIKHSGMVISVNTSAPHIAAAVGTPVLVLYALTNPQHTPWSANSEVLYFDVPPSLRSKNEVIRYAYEQFSLDNFPLATTNNILAKVKILFPQKEAIASAAFSFTRS